VGHIALEAPAGNSLILLLPSFFETDMVQQARRPVNVVVGSPLRVEKVGQGTPSKEAVDALHARYKQALCELFEEHKRTYGYGDTHLVIT